MASITAAEALPGAATKPEYVEDRSCAICHSEIYRSYQEVGMARSFFRPSAQKVIEDFENNVYFHEASNRYYEMSRRGDQYFFKRYQLDSDSKPINVFEQEIRWVLGSGNHSRTYLYRTDAGEIYLLPVAWYSQTKRWGMAPGFDTANHFGVLRRVRNGCMFCHNAYPDASLVHDRQFAEPTFPADLPEGTGCQRCHGPASEHVRAATEDLGNLDRVRSSIVNPARLSPELRDDVCDQCHFQPSKSLDAVRRFGRGYFSYRPGQSLPDYIVHIDGDFEGEKRAERFEINHHPYRLRQSRCFEASGRKLNCLTCHDPHRRVPEKQLAAHYRAACLGCHEVDACRLEKMTGELPQGVDPTDCVACHMSKRRTQDVVQVVMTDHLIRRRPGGPELLGPLAEKPSPPLVAIEILDGERGPAGNIGEMYRVVGAIRALGANDSAVQSLDGLLSRVLPVEAEPYLDFANAQISLGRLEEASDTLRHIRERFAGKDGLTALLATEWQAAAQLRLGNTRQAADLLRRVLDEDPSRIEARLNLSLALLADGEAAPAARLLESALGERGVAAPTWFSYLGEAYLELGRADDAARSFRRALEIDPTYGRSYVKLAEALDLQGKRDEALRYLTHGVGAARSPEPVAEALAALRAKPDLPRLPKGR